MQIFSRKAPTQAKNVRINKPEPSIKMIIAGSVIRLEKSETTNPFSAHA